MPTKTPPQDKDTWFLVRKPHWWSIQSLDERPILVYWLWDGSQESPARFWMLKISTGNVGHSIAGIFTEAGIGLDSHALAVEYFPNVPITETMVEADGLPS